MSVKLLTEHHLQFLSLKGGCIGSPESTHMSKCHIVGNHMSPLILKMLKKAKSKKGYQQKQLIQLRERRVALNIYRSQSLHNRLPLKDLGEKITNISFSIEKCPCQCCVTRAR